MKQIKNFLVIALALVVGFMAVTALGGQTADAETETETEADKGVRFRTAATGRVFVDPDIAYLTVGVSSEKETASEAMAEVNTTMEALLAAVKETGIADKDIKTANISIEMNYDYSGPRRVLLGYIARNSLSITIRDLDAVAKVLDATIAAGANDVGNLWFDKEDKQEAYDEALGLAVKRATDKINVLHAASGVGGTLTPVSFDELGVQMYAQNARQMDMAVAEEAAAAGVTVIPGTIEVVAQVSVEFKAAE